jgi:hypothetical protein
MEERGSPSRIVDTGFDIGLAVAEDVLRGRVGRDGVGVVDVGLSNVD